MATNKYEKRIGTRTILNTDFPVLACATGSGRDWTSYLLCNRTVESRKDHKTLRDAKARVDFLARTQNQDPITDAELWGA